MVVHSDLSASLLIANRCRLRQGRWAASVLRPRDVAERHARSATPVFSPLNLGEITQSDQDLDRCHARRLGVSRSCKSFRMQRFAKASDKRRCDPRIPRFDPRIPRQEILSAGVGGGSAGCLRGESTTSYYLDVFGIFPSTGPLNGAHLQNG